MSDRHVRRSAFLLLLLPACAVPGHEARTTLTYEIPVAGVHALEATSHNGELRVLGVEGCNSIRLQADLSVRGFSPEEAEANLAQLEVVREVADGRLCVHGRVDDALGDLAWSLSPTFAFTLHVPPAVAAKLTTHNGPIHVDGLTRELTLESHNGRVFARTSAARLGIATHNGAVDLAVAGEGPLAGSIETHNGSVELSVGPGRAVVVEASTHNGSLTARRPLDAMAVGDDTLRGSIGTGGGTLTVTTHNGDVVIQ